LSKGDKYEEKIHSIYRANHNVLAAGRNHHRFFGFESKCLSTSTYDAFSSCLGKRILSLQILGKLTTKNLDTFLTLWGQFLRLN
jgi:hypothetical protein